MLIQRPNRIVERRSTVSQFAPTKKTMKSIPFSLIGRRRKSLSSKSDYRRNGNKSDKENNSSLINLSPVAENENPPHEKPSAQPNSERLDEGNNNVPPIIEDEGPSHEGPSNEIPLIDLPPVKQNEMQSNPKAKSVLEVIGFIDSAELNPNQSAEHDTNPSNEESNLLLIDFSTAVENDNPSHRKPLAEQDSEQFDERNKNVLVDVPSVELNTNRLHQKNESSLIGSAFDEQSANQYVAKNAKSITKQNRKPVPTLLPIQSQHNIFRSTAANIIDQRASSIDLVLNVQLHPDFSTLPMNFEVDACFGKMVDDSDPDPDIEVEEEFGELRWNEESDDQMQYDE